MTRINVGVSPSELPRLALLAEHREITRIPNRVRSGRVNLENIPETFRLGTGHVRFFYNKMDYLAERYVQILIECYRRGYNVTNKIDSFLKLDKQKYQDLWQQYRPSPEDRQLVVERLKVRGHELIKAELN